MELSEFTFKIFLLFIPGLTAFIIFDYITSHKETKLHRAIIESLLFGFASYFIYFLITKIPWFELQISFLGSLTEKETPLNFLEISLATVISLPIALISARLDNSKLINRIATYLRVTNRHGHVDLWNYIMNSTDIPPWVVVRDIENDLTYEGWIEGFSDSTEMDELFIRDVNVYQNSTARLLYSTPGLYIPTKRENLTMEFPGLEFTEDFYRKDDSNGK